MSTEHAGTGRCNRTWGASDAAWTSGGEAGCERAAVSLIEPPLSRAAAGSQRRRFVADRRSGDGHTLVAVPRLHATPVVRGAGAAEQGRQPRMRTGPAGRLPRPVIRAGDRLFVEEHTAVGRSAVLRPSLWNRPRLGSISRRVSLIGGKGARAWRLGRPGRAGSLACSRWRAAMKPSLGRYARVGLLLCRCFCGSLPLPGEEAVRRPAQIHAARNGSARLHRAGARAAGSEVRTPGSIWSPKGRLVRLGTDAKAVARARRGVDRGQREPGRLDRRTGEELARLECQLRVTALVRRAKTSNSLQNLLSQTSSSGLTAQGQSTTNSSLATTFGAEVVDVLPNGMLVVQATRQLTFSQQTQLIQAARSGAPRGCERAEPSAIDRDDRSGTRSDRQGNRERLDLPAEPAGAFPGEAAGVLEAGNRDQGTRCRSRMIG